MTRFSVATLLAAALFVICTLDAAAQTVRTLRQTDQPITSRLLPDDRVVVIEPVMGSLHPSRLTNTREVELRDLARWEEVAVIHQARPQSLLVMSGTCSTPPAFAHLR